MGDCMSKDDCTHPCDDEYASNFQRPQQLDPQASSGFTFAAPAQGVKLVLGTQLYYRAPPPLALQLGGSDPSDSARAHTPSPPRVPVPPPVVTDASGTAPGGAAPRTAVSREPFDDASSDPAAPPKAADAQSVSVGREQQSAPTKTKKVAFAAAEAPAIRAISDSEKNDEDAIRTHARTIRVIGGSNFVHMMAFVAQYVVPAIHGPLLRLTVRNECQASLAIGVVPLAHAGQLYGPNRYLYDWRSPEVGGGGVTLWARDHATPFGIFDFPPYSKSRADPMHGLCVKGSLVTLELDVAARLVRLSVSPPSEEGDDNKMTRRNRSADVTQQRAITGTIRPHTVELDTPLIFVVAPMCKGDAVTIIPD